MRGRIVAICLIREGGGNRDAPTGRKVWRKVRTAEVGEVTPATISRCSNSPAKVEIGVDDGVRVGMRQHVAHVKTWRRWSWLGTARQGTSRSRCSPAQSIPRGTGEGGGNSNWRAANRIQY